MRNQVPEELLFSKEFKSRNVFQKNAENSYFKHKFEIPIINSITKMQITS